MEGELPMTWIDILTCKLFKTYIAPWLFGPAKPVPNPQAAVVETCQAVLGGVQQLQQAITSLQVRTI